MMASDSWNVNLSARAKHTRTIRTKTKPAKKASKTVARKKSIPWREALKQRIKKHSEGGLALRGARAREEVTQKQVAEALDISQHHISEMENGKRPIGKEMAKRLAEYFKTDYKVFL